MKTGHARRCKSESQMHNLLPNLTCRSVCGPPSEYAMSVVKKSGTAVQNETSAVRNAASFLIPSTSCFFMAARDVVDEDMAAKCNSDSSAFQSSKFNQKQQQCKSNSHTPTLKQYDAPLAHKLSTHATRVDLSCSPTGSFLY
jgi:hypothetical protein